MLSVLRVTAVLLQVGILLTLAEGSRRRNVPVVVNAAASFCVAVVPLLVGVVTDTPLTWSATSGAALTLWLAAAGLLHSVGMLGLYEGIDWWDHLTHTFSAALLAALAYAGVIVLAADAAWLPASWIGVATVLFVLLASVWWELLELLARDIGQRYGIEPVLVYYGRWDTALDLVFDLVGVLSVVLLDLRLFVPIAAAAPDATETLLLAGTGFFALSSVCFGVVVRSGFD